MRRAAGVASHPPSVSFSYELGKTVRDAISRSSLSDVHGLLVPRLALPSRRASRALFIIMVVARGVSSGAECLSFVLRAVWRCVIAHPIVVLLFSWDVAGLGVLPCLLVSSDCSSRVVELVVHSRLAVASRLVVSLSGDVLASHFISAASRWAAVLVLPYRRRCLLVLVPSGDGAMTFSSSAFPPASYHHMAAGSKPVMRPHLARRCLLLVPGGYRSCLVPFIRFETDGTGGGAAGYLAIGAWFIMPRR